MKCLSDSFNINTFKFIVLCSFLAITNIGYSQDVAITSRINPESGCNLTTNEEVGVNIINLSGYLIGGGSIEVSYVIDGGDTTRQFVGSNLADNATASFTFGTTTDLSECGSHDIEVWVDLEDDIDRTNDTLRWTVQNDCTVVPGEVFEDMTVCILGNEDTLYLENQMYGTIDSWLYSEDGGTTWTSTGTSDTAYIFNDLTIETNFSVAIDGGFCPNDTSDFATISIQAAPIGGTINGGDSLCITEASGSLELVGESASILDWENSTDEGNTWLEIGNTTNTQNYNNLTETTWYRALIDGEFCPDVYSDIATIYVEEETIPGTLNADAVVCGQDTEDLEVVGNNGDVLFWESSIDETSWEIINNTSNTYNTGVLDDSTYYRVIIQNGFCPADTTNQVIVELQIQPPTGFLSGSDEVCDTSGEGQFEIFGLASDVVSWEFSENEGEDWTTINNNTTVETYNAINTTSWYRVLIDGEACPDMYSDTAVVFVETLSNAGTLLLDTTICPEESVELTLENKFGTIQFWESSNDEGTSWSTINNANEHYITSQLESTTLYRVLVKNGICPSDTSNEAQVTVAPLPIVDAGEDVEIIEGDTIQLNATGGVTGVWMPGGSMSDSTIHDPLIFPQVTTVYTYSAISMDGCIDSDKILVTVNDPPEPFSIKNTITPNGDGFNDTWIIEGLEQFSSTAVKVFNIYGKEVYSNPDYQNEWGATYKEKLLPNGTYFYIVTPEGTDEQFKGEIFVIGNE